MFLSGLRYLAIAAVFLSCGLEHRFAYAGPLNTIVLSVEDISIPIPIKANTGITTPLFDATYILDYQYTTKDNLTFPDGRVHQVPRIEGPNGEPFIPYTQMRNDGCWDTGYLTTCRAGAPCPGRQPRCVANLLQGDAISIGGRIGIPGGRFLIPGELTPDGFALVPMETGIDRTLSANGNTYFARWVDYFPNTTTAASQTIQIQTPYLQGLPVTGGSGPMPDCIGTCYQIAPRAVIEVFGPLGPNSRFNVYMTGFNTSGNIFQDFVDTFNAADYLNNPSNPNPIITGHQQAIINFISNNGLNPLLGTGYGHSLGAECIAGLANAGWLSTGILIAPPSFISNEALQSKSWTSLTVYSADNDLISNSPFLNANQSRLTNGVNIITGTTGGLYSSHLRGSYFTTFPALPEF